MASGAKMDVVVKLVLVFFVSLLSFSIGTYVGRKYSDNQHKMAQLEPGNTTEHGERAIASEAEHNTGHGTDAKKSSETLTDEEIAKLAEEFVADEKTASNSAEDVHGEKQADSNHGEAHEENQKSAHKEENSTKTTATAESAKVESVKKEEPRMAAITTPSSMASTLAKTGSVPVTSTVVPKSSSHESRWPSSIPKDVAQYSVGKFTVQVASFATQEEAEKKSSEFQNKGYKAFIIPAQIKGKTWYRVSVGLFATEKEAKDYRLDFISKAKVESAIVQKISSQ